MEYNADQAFWIISGLRVLAKFAQKSDGFSQVNPSLLL